MSLCIEEHGLHSVCSSAVPCAPPLSGARSVFMCSCHAPRISTICVKKQAVVSLGLCWIHTLSDRPSGKIPPCAQAYVGHQWQHLRYERKHFVCWLHLCTEGPYLLLPPCHICGLFCIEWVSDTSHHKNIQLQLLFTVFFLSLQLLQIFFLLASGWRARAGRARTAAAAAGRKSTRALAGPAWRDAWSGLGGHRLFAFLLHYPIRFLLAGRRV